MSARTARRRRKQMAMNYAHLGNARGRPKYNFNRGLRSVADSIAAARAAAAREAKARAKK